MTLAIRRFRPDDAKACGDIVERTPLWQRYRLTGESLARQLVESTEPIFVAADDERPVGFAWILGKGLFGRSAYLRLIAVDPARRGEGIGEKLLRAFEEEARSSGRDAFLLVSDFNTAAQRFYRREGYEEIGRISDYVLDGVAEVLMRKRVG